MRKTIKLSNDPLSFGSEGFSIDFSKSKEVIAPVSFGVTTVSEMSNVDPLSKSSTGTYSYSGYKYTGFIALDREGTSTLVGSYYNADYTETVDTSLTKIKSITADATWFEEGISVSFRKLVSYESIAGKKIGQLIEDGDKVIGTAKADTLKMTGHNETVKAGGGNDKILGRAGNDHLHGAGGNDHLDGGAGRDTLYGDGGKDKLIGNDGADTLFGGKGSDSFVFRSIAHSTVKANGRDIIKDFSHKQGDVVDLRAIDADEGHRGNQKFHFVDTDKFSKDAGELHYTIKKSATILSGDVDGDGKADFSVKLDHKIELHHSDFLL